MPRFLHHRSRCALAAAFCLAGGLPLCAQTPGRFPLSAVAVAAALTRTGLPVEAAQIELPGALSATTPEPQLRITSADLLPDGRLRLRVSCRQAGDCQPFLAAVRLPSEQQSMASLENLQKALATDTPARRSSVDRLLAGQQATLLMENAHMRITIPVIVIDSGTPGSEVRVSSLDRKQIFRGVVADPGVVRGVLP